MEVTEENYLAHYGILRKSGRYPWGSGGTTEKRSKDFLDHIGGLRAQGMTDTEIARGFGMTTTEFRNVNSIAKNAQRAADIATAQKLRDKGMSTMAIARQMGRNESSIRSMLAAGVADRVNIVNAVSSELSREIGERKFIDVGAGVEHHLGISRNKLDTAVAALREQGYTKHYVKIPQLGTNKETTMIVLAAPGTAYKEVYQNRFDIRAPRVYSQDGGRSFLGVLPPKQVDSKRIAVRWAEDGGKEADGVIYLRPGVPDISLGGKRYGQVRIAVDGTHYLKGMAMYKDDLPPGVDLMVNSDKKRSANKLDAMKAIKDDPDNPFGSTIRQLTEIGPNGKPRVTSVLNIVGSPTNETSGVEGSWDTWSRNLSSQFLSKQSPKLAKNQLDMAHEAKKNELDAILALTNPAVKKKLLETYADGADSSAWHLKAAALPRQSSRVILPISSLKETEIYAPSFNNGERVVLVRHPHGGTFELPELTVNNRHREARKLLGDAEDAVGINHKVAEKLSGADFDGDTVLVIPNNHGHIKTDSPLAGLKNFDPKSRYPKYDGMQVMDERTKGIQMGNVSNLITDMTIKGASHEELARAVRHSMVVIDAEKHELNWKQSAIDNGIGQLKAKYQGSARSGASTLISRKKQNIVVPKRRPRSSVNGGPIDRATGKKMFEETGTSSFDRRTGLLRPDTEKAKRILEVDDVNVLSSGTRIEKVYADHSNALKELANKARLASLAVGTTPPSRSAKTAYSNEVASLDAKLKLAERNAPLERQAQLLANSILSAKRQSNPDMDKDEIKKVKFQALAEARTRTGANKHKIDITPEEWKAVQQGAISDHKLGRILDHTDLDVVKQYATPRTKVLMTSAKTRRAQDMLALGYTQAEVAAHLGVSVTTLKTSLTEGS